MELEQRELFRNVFIKTSDESTFYYGAKRTRHCQTGHHLLGCWVCFPRMPFIFDTFLSTYWFFLQVFAPSYSSVLVLWNLLYWPPFLFQTLHNFSLKPPTPQQNKCIDTFHYLWRDDLPFVQPLSFDIVFASKQWSSVLSRLRHAGALLAGLTLKGWCLLPASSEDIHKSLSGISHRKSSVY